MNDNDTELQHRLQEWKVTAPLPPRFQQEVWKRIERVETPAVLWTEVMRAQLAAWFARPALAVAYVSVVLVTGLALGFKQAQNTSAKWDRQLEARYVQSVDPYQRTSDR